MATMSSIPVVGDLMAPHEIGSRISQEECDSLSVCVDSRADCPSSKEVACSDEYGDMQLLAIKKNKEFPTLHAIMQAEERKPKMLLGLGQQELDKLCVSDASVPLQLDELDESTFNADARDDKLLYQKRARAFADHQGTTDAANSASSDDMQQQPVYLTQQQLDEIVREEANRIICKETDDGRRRSTGSTKCSSSEASSDEAVGKEDLANEEDGLESSEEESIYVKKKRNRRYLEKPFVAPHSGQSLGFSQPQLDAITSFDEADQANVPECNSSPHGSALLAIKKGRERDNKREHIEPVRLAFNMDQAQLDNLVVEAEDESDEVGEHAAIKRARSLGIDLVRPTPKMGTDQAELDIMCVSEDGDDEQEQEHSSPSKANKAHLEIECHWSPSNSPRRSNTSSPCGAKVEAKSPVHGGA